MLRHVLWLAVVIKGQTDDASARIKNILDRVGTDASAPDGASASDVLKRLRRDESGGDDLRARLDRLRAAPAAEAKWPGPDASAEAARLFDEAAETAGAERAAAEQAEAARGAAETAERERLAVEADRVAEAEAERADQERAAASEADAERRAQAEGKKTARERAEADRDEPVRLFTGNAADAGRVAAEKAETDRVAAEEASGQARLETERLAAETAEAARAAEERRLAEAAEADRIAAETAEAESIVKRERADAEREAAEEAAATERLAAEQAEADAAAAPDAEAEERPEPETRPDPGAEPETEPDASSESEPTPDPEPEAEPEPNEPEPDTEPTWGAADEEPLPTDGAAYIRFKARREMARAEQLQKKAEESLKEARAIQTLAPRDQLERRRLKAEEASGAHWAARSDQAEKMRLHRDRRRERTQRMRELEAARGREQGERRQAKEELLAFSSIKHDKEGDLRDAAKRWKQAVELREDVDAMFALAFAYEAGGPGLEQDLEAAEAWKARAESAAVSEIEEAVEAPVEARGVVESSGGDLIRWRFKADTLLSSGAPVIVSGVVVAAGFAEGLYGIDAETGAPAWFLNGGPYTSVAATDDAVVVGSRSGELRLIDARTGRERWRADNAGEVGRIVVSEDIYGGVGPNVVGLRVATGALKWVFPTNQLVTGAPAANARHVYAGSVDAHVYALRAHDGRVRWRVKTGGPVEANLVLSAGVVYAGSHDHKVYALDTQAGEEVWALNVGAPVVALLLVGHVLVVSTHAALVAVDARGGVVSWTRASGEVRWTAPRLAGDALIMAGTDLKLTAVNVADGAVRWRHDAASYNAAPAVVGKRLVVASRDKRVQLLALDALDRLYEYEGAKRDILAAARADLDAEAETAASDEEVSQASDTSAAAEETPEAAEHDAVVAAPGGSDAGYVEAAAEPDSVEEAAPDGGAAADARADADVAAGTSAKQASGEGDV